MIYARQHTAQCVKILREGHFETIRAGVIVYLISWKVIFRYHLRAVSCSCFSRQMSKNRTLFMLLFWFLKTLSGNKRSFLLRFCHHWFSYARYLSVADSFSSFFFFLPSLKIWLFYL